MWPNLCKGKSLVAVGTPLSGKTFGFVVPLLNAVLKRAIRNTGGKGKRPKLECPFAVVVCPSWRSAEKVAKQIDLILEGNGESMTRPHSLL